MINTFEHSQSSAQQRYDALSREREPYITRAERCARYTIPLAFPKQGSTYASDFETPYQSIGARGVNNLSAKMLTALIPPNTPFFRLGLGAAISRTLQAQPDKAKRWEVILSQLEKNAVTYMESNLHLRPTASEAFNQLLIAGNALLFLPPKEGGMRMYRLSNYVCQRDGLGEVLELVTLDCLAAISLPEEAKSMIAADAEPSTPVKVYTYVYLEGDTYHSYQEIEGKVVPSSNQSYPKDKSPWIAIRLRKMDGESYGRSFVDEYIGDLASLEALSKSIVETSAICSQVLYVVNPNSTTSVSKFSKAKSGDFVTGRLEDIQILQTNKSQDLQVSSATASQIESRLSFAFLLNSAVQRQAERVTAEEIRYVANELEQTIGSIYSILGQEFQLPLIRRVLSQMEHDGCMPDLPQGMKGIQPMITTGIDALGRGNDLANIDTFIRYAQVFPNAYNTAVKQNNILTIVATALNLDPQEFIKTDEEVQQDQQQAAALQAIASGGGQMLNQNGGDSNNA